jgi:chromosomal replication initiation ATPase DnaA
MSNNREIPLAYTFENFIATDTNAEAKQIAMDFAAGKSSLKTLVIASSIGNGATHLACAIANEIKFNQNKDDILLISFESLVMKIKNEGELSKEFLNSHSIIIIDSYYNWNKKLSKYLISTLIDVNTKIVITCSEFTEVPVDNYRINLSLPIHSDRILILENLIKMQNLI